MKVSMTFTELDPAEAAHLLMQAGGKVNLNQGSAVASLGSQAAQQPAAAAPLQPVPLQPAPQPVPLQPAPGAAAAGGITHEQVTLAMQQWITHHKAGPAKKILETLAAGAHQARVKDFPLDKLPALLQAFSNPPAA